MWTPEEEATNLKRRFDAVKASPDMTIRKFAKMHQLPGGPSFISQHTSGNRPIGMDSAIAYARAFGVPLEEISPRLAAEAVAQAKAVGVAPPAPPVAPPGPAPDVHIALEAIARRLMTADASTRELVAGMLASMAKSPESYSRVATGLQAILSDGHSDEAVERKMPATKSFKRAEKQDADQEK